MGPVDTLKLATFNSVSLLERPGVQVNFVVSHFTATPFWESLEHGLRRNDNSAP